MSYKALILNAAVDPSFRLRAFSDYCEKKQRIAQEYIQVLNEVVDSVEVTDSGSETTTSVSQILTKHSNFNPNSYVLLSQGYCKLSDLLTAVQNKLAVSLTTDNSLYDATTNGIDLINAAGAYVSKLSVADVLEEAQSSLHSITALCAANAAALVDNIADKISIFRDRMQRYFQSGFSDLSNMASYYLSIVEQTHSQEEYLEQVDAGLNITQMAADNSIEIPANSRVYDITGASPVGPLNWNTVESSVNSAINVGVKVVKGIFSTVKKGVQKLFSKAKKYVHEVVTNPFDVALDFPDNELNTVDGYCYQMTTQEGRGWMINKRLVAPSLPESDFLSLQGSLFKTCLISGELLVKPTSISEVASTDVYGITGQMAFKPRPINEWVYKKFFQNLSAYMTELEDPTAIMMSGDTIAAIVDSLNAMATNPDVYATVESNERELLKSYIYGYLLTLFLLTADDYEQNYSTEDRYIHYIPAETIESIVGSTVTNLSFVQVAAGWNGTTFSSDFFAATNTNASAYPNVFTSDAISTTGNLYGIFRYAYTWFVGIVRSMSQEIDSPLDFPFIPYRKDKEGFATSQYSIKTDTRNYEAFNSFAIKVIVTAIAAAVAITGVVVSKKILRSITNKRIQLKSQIEARLWKDPPDNVVSNSELRKYARMSRKLDASKLLNSELQSSSGSVLTSFMGSGNDSLIDDIITILRG